MNQTRILIVGGGFGGVKAALELGKQKQFAVTLLTDQPHFRYYPTLYHTATGGTVAQSSIPLNRLFTATPGVTVALGTAEHLERKDKRVVTSDGTAYPYDVLIMALGSVPNYFGIKGVEQYSHSITTPEKAKEFKEFLHAQLHNDLQPDLNYVVVGAGPTGIELASSLPAYVKKVMQAHGLEPRTVHVDIIEAAPKLLPRMPERMSNAVAKRLKRLGVRIYLNQKVEGETADNLMVNGKAIRSHAVVWTAGSANHPFFKANEFALNERGKVTVDEYLQAEPDIYVLGDNADTQYAGMAQTALYDALFVARNLKRQASKRLMERYVPKRPIYVIPVGKNWAAVLWGNVQLYGLLGWTLRLMADLVAFKDYEPWWRAGKQWMTEFQKEDNCPTCAKH